MIQRRVTATVGRLFGPVLSKVELVQSNAPGMAPWRKRLFLATAHIAADAVDYCQLPRHRTVPLGSAIEV